MSHIIIKEGPTLDFTHKMLSLDVMDLEHLPVTL